MAKFRKKAIAIEAYQWFRVSEYVKGQRRDVGHYRRPGLDGQEKCKHCGVIMHDHGWIDTLEGGHIVCPKDWIITGVEGERYPCKPGIFEKTYEPVL